ncbi:MAG: hypothetical protein U0230_10890 [Polyangiales bacterium]
MPSMLRFRSYLRAPPRTVRAEMKALGLECHRMADRFFDEKDLSRLCLELFGAAPGPFDWNARSGAGSVERFEIEFDEVPGPLETTWGFRFWDADTHAWGDAPAVRGLELVTYDFHDPSAAGRDGMAGGSRAARLYDHGADWIVTFAVGTRRSLVFAGGRGVKGILERVRAVLGS